MLNYDRIKRKVVIFKNSGVRKRFWKPNIFFLVFSVLKQNNFVKCDKIGIFVWYYTLKILEHSSYCICNFYLLFLFKIFISNYIHIIAKASKSECVTLSKKKYIYFIIFNILYIDIIYIKLVSIHNIYFSLILTIILLDAHIDIEALIYISSVQCETLLADFPLGIKVKFTGKVMKWKNHYINDYRMNCIWTINGIDQFINENINFLSNSKI